ncbi:hypothetical protein ATK36_0487 [Amycolatopsis sulphurea]|uniref:Tetratricopeptide repeat protein n=1 Tax=Amycolatopsis sulphurea TaxID=76022 RepID=A0A2A9G220_9PSEU|nr:hypothetical protein [Amycolatopsis sulphurea]PFG56951.1 hypothetical protein ATK36_0487 [Amycolatopsis sulphurea]
MDKRLKNEYRRNAADEAVAATALSDKANALEAAGRFREAGSYFQAAARAEGRAAAWRNLLR